MWKYQKYQKQLPLPRCQTVNAQHIFIYIYIYVYRKVKIIQFQQYTTSFIASQTVARTTNEKKRLNENGFDEKLLICVLI